MSQLIKQSLIKDNLAAYAPAYEHLYQYAGDTVTLMDPLDVANGFFPSSSTFTTRRRTASGLEAVFTASPSAPINHDTPPTLTQPSGYQGIIPFVTLNGTDEYWTSPDADYWSAGDGSNDSPFSVAFWIKPQSGMSLGYLLSKANAGAGSDEWYISTSAVYKINVGLKDQSAGAFQERLRDTALVPDVWSHVVISYDGRGGSTAADGIVIYVNTVVGSYTDIHNAGYVAMENLTPLVALGAIGNSAGGFNNLWTGSIACGPCSPWFSQIEMTADHIALIYNEQASLLGLRP